MTGRRMRAQGQGWAGIAFPIPRIPPARSRRRPTQEPGDEKPGYDESDYGRSEYREPKFPGGGLPRVRVRPPRYRRADYAEPRLPRARVHRARYAHRDRRPPPRHRRRRARSTAATGKAVNGRAATAPWPAAGVASVSASSPRWSTVVVVVAACHPVALLRRRAVQPQRSRRRPLRGRRARRRGHRRPVDRRAGADAGRTNTTRPPTRSATAASRSASNPPTPTRWSTASSATGRPNWASGPPCGFRPARCRRPDWKPRRVRRPISDSRSLVTSPVLLAVRPQLKELWPSRIGRRLPDFRRIRPRWTGWICRVGDHCGSRCRAAATATPPTWRPKPWPPHPHLPVPRPAPGWVRSTR